MQPCKFFARGNCLYGTQCKFSHDLSSYEYTNDEDSEKLSALWRRKWTFFEVQNGQQAKEDTSDEFSILNLNLLAESLIDVVYYPDNRYLDWTFRRETFLRQIKNISPDVLAFQEYDEEWLEDRFHVALKAEGYSSCYLKRTGEKKDGCAIYYRGSDFELIEESKLKFVEHHDELMDRDNVALSIVLKHKASRNKLIISCTHLLFNPTRGDIKLMQLKTLLDELCMLRSKHSCGIVLCGDFNATPGQYNHGSTLSLIHLDSAIYHLLSFGALKDHIPDRRFLSGQKRIMSIISARGVMSYRFYRPGHRFSGSFFGKYQIAETITKKESNFLEIIDDTNKKLSARKKPRLPFEVPPRLLDMESGLEFRSVYSAGNNSDNHTGEPAFTSFHGSFAGTVDYIWYDPEAFVVMAILELPKPAAFMSSSLPCKHWGSDHLSLVTKLKFRKREDERSLQNC